MDVNHVVIVICFEKEVNSPLKGVQEKQLAKKRPNVSCNAIFKKIDVKDHFKREFVQKQ